MDSATKPAKPSSNISGIVCRFANVCRLRSVGVFSGENPNHHDHNNKNSVPSTEDCSNATEESQCEGKKILPQPVQEIPIKNHATEILKLFDTISALKLAYIQLQEAHILYNPQKIQAADDLVVSELEALCEIKRKYKQKHISKSKSDSSLSIPFLLAEIQDHESLLEKLQSQIKAKDSEILQLWDELQVLNGENSELDEKFKQKALEKENALPYKDLHPNVLYEAFDAAFKSIHHFAKPLISLMKASGWDLDLAANSIEDSIIYSKRSHKKYAFEAYLSRRMFHGFTLLSQNVDEIARAEDPFDALIKYPNSNFSKFCRSKYLLIVHSTMEASFFGNLDQRTFVLSGKHPRTPFYQAFVKMAKWIWFLQAIAGSVKPKAEIFAVGRRSEFKEAYMESVVDDGHDTVLFDDGQGELKVGIMVMPGFRIGETVLRSRVYLSRINSSGAC
ncbi:hypothetical protein HHK36_018659 [Tetracentron sinense]|uniref:DUF641 domain-containing protein n=1 Tax=Tetracentron sinense TaxID=13715 RepID=A0A835DBH1_TETSI|nr:hypothetical protein HHK36_018659 [Tetracentron sinense]